MLASSGGLLRAGLALKLDQLKLAARSYLRDRTFSAGLIPAATLLGPAAVRRGHRAPRIEA